MGLFTTAHVQSDIDPAAQGSGMGKKKKGGKGKEKSEDGLPPPPNLDNYREGAQEALLTFKLARSNWIRYLNPDAVCYAI